MSEEVRSPHPIEVVWEGGRRFRGGLPEAATITLDGDRQAGPSPVDSLLVAMAACSGIDVVEILGKRRTPVASLTVHLEFARAAEPPRRLTSIDAHFKVATNSERHHVERAIELSLEKYCSVSATFAPDTLISWSLEILPGAPAGPEPGVSA